MRDRLDEARDGEKSGGAFIFSEPMRLAVAWAEHAGGEFRASLSDNHLKIQRGITIPCGPMRENGGQINNCSLSSATCGN
jgi:hypothetical protein